MSDEGYIFEAAEEVTFAPGETTKTIPAYEGETITETFFSTGAANQVYAPRRIPATKWIAAGSSCTVDGATWEEARFLEYPASDQYEISYATNPPTLSFGDGIVGNIPTAGVQIVLTYVATSGRAGQVADGSITSARSPLVVNFTSISPAVNNPERARGGDDPEELAESKANAPMVWKSREVAVTREDYESLSGTYADPLAGRVAVARALVGHSAENDLTLRILLSSINAAVQEPEPTVSQAVSDATAALDQADSDLSDLETNFVDIATETNGIDTTLQAAIASARLTKTRTSDINSETTLIAGNTTDIGTSTTDIGTQVTGGKAFVSGLPTNPTSQLSTADAASLTAFFDTIQTDSDAIDTSRTKINTENGNIITASSSIDTSTTSQITAMGQVRDKAAAVGLTVASAGSLLEAAEASRASIVAVLGVVGPPATGVREDLDDIDAAVTDVSNTVEGYTTDIYEHVDGLLASDCKANLVTVPILTRNSGGFYDAPTTALIRSLQEYLDERKEVTQVVRVVSGEDFLVEAVITVRLSILTGYSVQRVQATAEAAIDTILRDRDFAGSLYVEELYDALDVIDAETHFVNAEISGHYDTDGTTVLTTKLDANGNLIVAASEIVTKGALTVTTEVYTEPIT